MIHFPFQNRRTLTALLEAEINYLEGILNQQGGKRPAGGAARPAAARPAARPAHGAANGHHHAKPRPQPAHVILILENLHILFYRTYSFFVFLF